MSTWTDFLAQVRRELEEPTEGVWADASLLYWVNAATTEIASRVKNTRDWQYSTSAVGQNSYTLPEQTLEVISVFFGTGDARYQLQRVEFADFSRLDDTSTDTPIYYTVDDDALYLWPTPSTADEISFFRFYLPEILAGTEDESMPFNGQYDPAIGLYVKSRAFEQVGDFDTADALLGRYEQMVDRIANQEGIEAQSGRAVQPREVW